MQLDLNYIIESPLNSPRCKKLNKYNGAVAKLFSYIFYIFI